MHYEIIINKGKIPMNPIAQPLAYTHNSQYAIIIMMHQNMQYSAEADWSGQQNSKKIDARLLALNFLSIY